MSVSILSWMRNNVALLHPDTELDTIAARFNGISRIHRLLPLGRTTHGINHTGKFGHRFHDTAPVFGDLWVNNVGPDRPLAG